jgi:uncharacterized protein (DUF1684 family)
MIRTTMKHYLTALALLAGILLSSCGDETPRRGFPVEDRARAVNETMQFRRNAEEYFRNHRDSPFKTEPAVPYEGIRWFPPDPEYYFLTKLVRTENPETVVVFGTKGEPRNQMRIGYFPINIGGTEYRLNVYKETNDAIRRHPALAANLSVWFTDETTGKETYDVGRYVTIEPENPDPDHLYIVNLNNAHNPYCAYNPAYSCAIPTKDDHLPVPIRAGELKYHSE